MYKDPVSKLGLIVRFQVDMNLGGHSSTSYRPFLPVQPVLGPGEFGSGLSVADRGRISHLVLDGKGRDGYLLVVV